MLEKRNSTICEQAAKYISRRRISEAERVGEVISVGWVPYCNCDINIRNDIDGKGASEIWAGETTGTAKTTETAKTTRMAETTGMAEPYERWLEKSRRCFVFGLRDHDATVTTKPERI
jgi:hypothetical protein